MLKLKSNITLSGSRARSGTGLYRFCNHCCDDCVPREWVGLSACSPQYGLKFGGIL